MQLLDGLLLTRRLIKVGQAVLGIFCRQVSEILHIGDSKNSAIEFNWHLLKSALFCVKKES